MNKSLQKRLQDQLRLQRDPEHQKSLSCADVALDRVDAARQRLEAWERADHGNRPSEMMLLDENLPKVRLDLERSRRMLQAARGDFIDEASGVESASSVESARADPIVPLSRRSAQEAAILAKLEELGFNATGIPRPSPGRPGVKAEVRAALGKGGMWTHPWVFPKTWQRLRDSGQIEDLPG